MSRFEHTIEPELRGRLPRSVRDTTATRTVRRWWWNLLPAALCLAYFLAAHDVAHWQNLQLRGIVATGHVTDKREEHGKSTTYYVLYEFQAGSHLVCGSDEVSATSYSGTNPGDALTFTYLPENPEEYEEGIVNHRSVDNEQRKDIGFIVLGSAVYLACLLMMEQYYANRRKMLREGIAATAVVVGRREVKAKQITYYVRYEFTDPRTGSKVSREIAVEKSRFDQCSEGEEFTVLFLPTDRNQSIPYFNLTQVEVEDMSRTRTG